MSSEIKSPEGTLPNPADEGKTDPKTANSNNPESVPYDKFRELLDEKKKLAASFSEAKSTLDKLLADKEENERKSLEEKQEFKKLYEEEKKRTEKAMAILELKKKEETENKKFEAFQEKVGGLRKAEYRRFVDTEAIPLVDGKVDEQALEAYAAKFRQDFPELVKETQKTPPPGTSPKSGNTQPHTGKLTAADLLQAFKQERLSTLKSN
jgi:oligoendopeptidase F